LVLNPPPLTPEKWAEPDPNSFRVRGPSYKTDRLKINAGASIGRLVAADVIWSESPIYSGFTVHPNERLQLALRKEKVLLQRGRTGTMPPFVFVVTIVLPGPPYYYGVYYFAVDDMSTIDGSDGTPSSRLCNQFFFGESDQFRDRTFKMIPQIVQGNFIVRKAVGDTPAIMGTKLRQLYVKGERFFEVILDCGSSSVATGVIRLSLSYAKMLVIDMGFLFEGDEPSTLPERLFGAVRMKQVEFGPHLRKVEPPPIGTTS
jgi:Protein ENHANCED DISEASE RESISTANCE 2, C-terminal